MADRLLTDDYLKNLFCDKCPYESDCTGIECKEYCKLIIKARQLREDQDHKSVKAVIEEIEFQKYELCDAETFETGRSICLLQQDDDCNNPCRFMSENCRWWQQFKERMLK